MQHSTKVLFWNIWAHREEESVHEYLKAHAEDTDVLCLTEVTNISLSQLKGAGTNICHNERADESASRVNGEALLRSEFGDIYNCIYNASDSRNWTCAKEGTSFENVGFGSAMLIRKDLELIDVGAETFSYSIADDTCRQKIMQWVVFKKGKDVVLVAHLHGVWIKGNTKGDHLVRFAQSQFIREKLNWLRKKYLVDLLVFGGDLNLDMETYALRLLEDGAGDGELFLENHIKSLGITSTRTQRYREANTEGHSQFADYIFTNIGVEVESVVVDTEVEGSDHAALHIVFS